METRPEAEMACAVRACSFLLRRQQDAAFTWQDGCCSPATDSAGVTAMPLRQYELRGSCCSTLSRLVPQPLARR